MKDPLIIFDTTLRDGEQSPGASMTKEEKLRIARQLERMRVDVIEAGFAAASPGDFEAVRAVAEAIKESTVCSLARANAADIERAAEAIRPAKRGRIHMKDVADVSRCHRDIAHSQKDWHHVQHHQRLDGRLDSQDAEASRAGQRP